jgi:peroxiredoxin
MRMCGLGFLLGIYANVKLHNQDVPEEIHSYEQPFLLEQPVLPHADGPSIAPDFTLPDMQGKSHTLSAYEGIVLLNFWESYSSACEKELPFLQNVASRYKNLAVLTVTTDAYGEASDLVRKLRFKLPVLLDANAAVRVQYDVREIPTSFLMRDRRLVHLYERRIYDDVGFQRDLKQMLQQNSA